MEINPQYLIGYWKEGWALDLHTLYSISIAPELNIWDTKRPPIAEELYLLKYRNEKFRAKNIAKVASEFLTAKERNINVIIPIPPSNTSRLFQPVYEIAEHISNLCQTPLDTSSLKKVKSTSQLKNIYDPNQRKELLKDAFDIEESCLINKNVLVFDDLYRSGEILNAACDVIINKGKARVVYVLTITKTRSVR